MTNEQTFQFKQLWKRGEFISNESTLDITGLSFDDNKIHVPTGFMIKDKISKVRNNNNVKQQETIKQKGSMSNNNNNRNLQQQQQQQEELVDYGSQIGIKNVLAVRVTDINGLSPPESAIEISNDIFGTYGDVVTLKSQLDNCSMNRLTINPGIPSHTEYYSVTRHYYTH